MSAENSLISFDQLATEIFFEIFDYLSCNDIIYTFFHLNKRLNSILLQNHRFLNNLSTPTRHFTFWQKILPIISSKIKCLTITTTEFSFSLNLFTNLKSLIISSSLPIFHDELTLILKNEQFKKLNLFKIKSEIIKQSDTYEALFFNEIFQNENSLHIFESFQELYSTSFRHVNDLKISLNLQSLSLKIFDFNCLVSLLNYFPNLKYLNIILYFLPVNERPNFNIDLSQIKLKKISILVENVMITESFPFFTWFIKQFSSSLIYLSLNLNQINTNNFQFNGLILQQQLLQSMIQLKSFHFYTQLDEEPINVEHLLSSFQTQFWFDHHWIFGTHGIHLYTLPFHFDKFNDFIDFNQIKSSNSNIFNSLQTWSHVKSIDFDESFKLNLNILQQIKLNMPNLTSTTFNYHLMNNLYTIDVETNQTDIRFDSITTVHCQSCYLRIIKHWLSHIFPNTRYLILSYDIQPAAFSLDEMEVLQKFYEQFRDKRTRTDYIYSSRIQYVEIKVILRENEMVIDWGTDYIYQQITVLVRELLELFKNLESFIFHFYRIPRFSLKPFTDLTKTIQWLNMAKISEKYQIKHIHNCLQFVRKNNE